MTRSAPRASCIGLAARTARAGAVSGLLVLGSAGAVLAGEINAADGLAIKGYDPVAYFSENRPVPGSAAFTADYRGATFRFASAGNRDEFRADPAAFAPQYGGYCAYAAANGYKADTDPAAFAVVSGRLYLNYNADIQAKWSADTAGYIAQGDRNWPEVVKLTDVVR